MSIDRYVGTFRTITVDNENRSQLNSVSQIEIGTLFATRRGIITWKGQTYTTAGIYFGIFSEFRLNTLAPASRLCIIGAWRERNDNETN